jgi:hypothetical protein
LSDALAKWRERSMFDVSFDDGTTYTCVLPNVQECLTEGDVPTPVLAKLAQKVKEGEDAPEDDTSGLELLRHMNQLHKRLVIKLVKRIDGDDVTLADDDLAYMKPEHFERLKQIANREVSPEGEA